MPSLVVSAHEECSLPPTKYRLSNTLAGSANQVSRGGALLGSVTYAGASLVRFSPPLCGSKQVLTRVPRNSKPAALFAACNAALISAWKFLLVGLCCANDSPVPKASKTISAIAGLPLASFIVPPFTKYTTLISNKAGHMSIKFFVSDRHWRTTENRSVWGHS